VDDILQQTLTAVSRAAAYLRFAYRAHAHGRIHKKGRADYVTDSDHTIQDMLIASLQDIKKGDIIAEEGEIFSQKGADFEWIIDPIDGTTNFIHKFPFVSISVALRGKEEGLLMGVVANAIADDVYYALKGQGAYKNGRKLNVSSVSALDSAFIATGFPFRHPEAVSRYTRLFQRLLQRVAGMRRAGSAALDLALTAEGVFDGFFEYGLKPWDVAAGILLVQEAGGSVSGFAKHQRALYDSRILATNGKVHNAMLQEIGHIFHEA